MKKLILGGLRESTKTKIQLLVGQRFFSDRLSWAILLPTLALNVATAVLLSLKVHPTQFVVPVRYSNLVGFDQLGPWYQSYFVGIFAIVISLVNMALAIASFGRSRLTSFFLLAGAFVVALFSLVISTAFTTVT